jgi:hypothetical protein
MFCYGQYGFYKVGGSTGAAICGPFQLSTPINSFSAVARVSHEEALSKSQNVNKFRVPFRVTSALVSPVGPRRHYGQCVFS